MFGVYLSIVGQNVLLLLQFFPGPTVTGSIIVSLLNSGVETGQKDEGVWYVGAVLSR